ncbi:hypothetical protein WA158_003995 [Blastocystis sp. Blastoise]
MQGDKYDTDVVTWSPEGKLHQVKYATEAEKQGSACVGVCNKNYTILGAVRRRPNEFAAYQQKILDIDEHMGIAISGLTADARALASYMRSECMEYEYVYGKKMPIERLVNQVADKKHFCTLTYERRPYGVGLLIAGLDKSGAHLFHTSPSGNYEQFSVQCIGARSQSAKTYFNKYYLDRETGLGHIPEDEPVDTLITHVLNSLKGCMQGDEELSKSNCSIAIIGKDTPFKLLSEDEIDNYLQSIQNEANAMN